MYCRSLLLWSFCTRDDAKNLRTRDDCTRDAAGSFCTRDDVFRTRDGAVDEEQKAEDIQETWVEAQAIEDALDGHGCGLEVGVVYMCREIISKCVLFFLPSFTSNWADDFFYSTLVARG